MRLEYSYNALKGVLDSRINHIFGKTETFAYDDLDRLLTEAVNGTVVQQYTYDQRGRMTSNTQLGKYNYDETNYKLKGVQYNTSGNQVNPATARPERSEKTK